MKNLGRQKGAHNFLVAIAVLVLAGCSQSPVESIPAASKLPNLQTNDTSILDATVQNDPRAVEFVARVKLFYQALERKDWAATYDFRTADFKQDVGRDFYLKNMVEDGKGWSLDTYKVLNINSYSDANGAYATQLIMEFQEGGIQSYGCAVWKKEGGAWLCDEPGLSGPALLRSTRVPNWVNH